MLILNAVLLIVGMALLIKGADFFVDGASKIAKSMKISSLIIGLTLVSIGTSAPELSVSITSAIAKMNDMSFGNVIGSNLFNTFMVIGVSALFVDLSVSKNMKKYDIPILIGIYILLALFSFVITPGTLSMVESIILIALLPAYIVFLIIRSKNEPYEEEEEDPRRWYINVLYVILGLAAIVIGGDLVVDNASAVATACGMSELLVGLTIVAVGTSLPELVTSIVAARKGEHDMAVGNAIGSSIFNVLLILGATSAINPLNIELSYLVDLVVMLLSAILVFIFSFKKEKIVKWQGIVLILCYVAYLAYVVARNIMAV